MIWTEKTLAKWEQENRPGIERMRTKIHGELPLESNKNDKSVRLTTYIPAKRKTNSFDRTAYQREYMRKRRTAKKEGAR